MSFNSSLSCRNCFKAFETSKGLSVHLSRNNECRVLYLNSYDYLQRSSECFQENKRPKTNETDQDTNQIEFIDFESERDMSSSNSDQMVHNQFVFGNDSSVEVH